jgi:hypothetical protein
MRTADHDAIALHAATPETSGVPDVSLHSAEVGQARLPGVTIALCAGLALPEREAGKKLACFSQPRFTCQPISSSAPGEAM